jgi:anti-sigma regulatory factor (Ser/Thr protein kinase)
VSETRAYAATLEAAAEAETWALAQAGQLGLSSDEAFSLMLCVEELFVNVVSHGGARNVRLAIARDSLEFRDDGDAFDPTEAPPRREDEPDADFEIGGFGLKLLQRFADRIAWRREDDWNVVTLAFGGAAAQPARD